MLGAACGGGGLVGKVNGIAGQERPQSPNGTLQADWGVVNGAMLLLKGMKIISLGWVKAHQDGKAPYQDLPHGAKLGCVAGKLAGGAQKNCPSK